MPRSPYVVLGPTPPPLGGVSVHVSRAVRRLRDRGVEVRVLDLPKLSRPRAFLALLRCVLDPRHSTYHVHGLDVVALRALALRPFPARLIHHTHSVHPLRDPPPRLRRALRKFLRKADRAILVGEHLRDAYADLGIELPEDTRVESPFVPPPEQDEEQILATYPEETRRFLAVRRPLLVANAFRLVLQNGTDLYGLDLCVDLVAALREEHPEVGMLFGLAEAGDETYFAEIRSRIRAGGLEDHIHFLRDQRELWPALKRADALVRPTSSDGFGISVAEALHLGCPAIASDVCSRPEGTRLFRSRDGTDLLRVVREVLRGS